MLALHAAGQAHSVECWDGELVGGLYGLALGRAFFGESMFSRRPTRRRSRSRGSSRASGSAVSPCSTAGFRPRISLHWERSACRARPMSRCSRPRSGGFGHGGSLGGRIGRTGRAGARRLISARSTGCSTLPRARHRGPGRSHRAALDPDVVDRVLDDVERWRLLVEPARKSSGSHSVRAAARRAGRRRRSSARAPTARSDRTR